MQTAYVQLIWNFQWLLTGTRATSVRKYRTIRRTARNPRAFKVSREKNMKIFNFEVEWKLYHHFRVEFNGEFDGNSLEALNSNFDPIIGPNWSIIGQKMKIFLFELEEKLDLHFQVKFDDKSNGNSLEVLK